MNQNQCLLKKQNFAICEETGSPQHQKLTSGLEDSELNENRIEKFQQKYENFQINTLVLEKSSLNLQRTTSDFNYISVKTEINKIEIQKIKVENKQKKKKKAFTLDNVLKSYLNFVEKDYHAPGKDSFLNYVYRRNSIFDEVNSSKIDLGVYNIKQIVELCFNRNLISYQVHVQYSYQKEFIEEENFIKKFVNKKLDQVQLNKMYFTPFDHRLLCRILCQQFPSQFEFPSNLLQESQTLMKFYTYLYWLSDLQYCQLYQNLNILYNRTWMPEGFPCLNGKLSQKLKNLSNSKQEQSFPFHMPPRKLRKKY